MRISEFPLMEFDPSRNAVIDPARAITPLVVPEPFVLCFFRDAIARPATTKRRAPNAGQG